MAMSGATGDGNTDTGRLALQPREVKFDSVVTPSENRFSEFTTGGRRGFKAPSKLQALGGRTTRHSNIPEHDFGADEGIGGQRPPVRGDPSGTPHHVSHAGGGGAAVTTIGLTSSSLAGERSPHAGPIKAPRGFTVQTTGDNALSDGHKQPRRRRHDGNPLDPRKVATMGAGAVKWGAGPASSKGSSARGLAPLATVADSKRKSVQSLHIEGNSVLAADSGLAANALTQLTECVARERTLREQLETARAEKVVAFRAVIKIFLDTCKTDNNSSRFTSRLFPDALAVARCSVVTNTLVSTIQSYVRAKQSRQLTQVLQYLSRQLGGNSPFPSDYCETLRRNTSELQHQQTGDDRDTPSVDPASATFSATMASAEDVLDLDEVNKLKQLYFDYFDCEVVPLPSMEESNAIEHGFAPRPDARRSGDDFNSTNPTSMQSGTLVNSSMDQVGEDIASTFSMTM